MNRVMDELTIPLGNYPIGDEPFTAMIATDRQAVLDLLDEVKAIRGKDGYFEITMHCGYSQRFEKHEDIPFEDLPCPCGKSDYYLIKYKE